MIEEVFRYRRIKNGLIVSLLILFVLVLSIGSFFAYRTIKQLTYQRVDRQLRSAVYAAHIALPGTFWTQSHSLNAITSKEDRAHTLRLSTLAKQMGVTYLYAMVYRDNAVYFIASSATDQELAAGDVTSYFDPYPEATPALKHLFDHGGELLEESSDRWGRFRSLLIAFEGPNHERYVIGADMDVEEIHQDLQSTLYWLVIFDQVVLLVVVGSGLFFFRLSRQDMQSVKTLRRSLQQKIDEQTAALIRANRTLEERIAQEVQKSREKDHQFLRQSRLAQMGEMIGMIAHQWRQPLTAISGVAVALEIKTVQGKCDPKEVAKLAQKISALTHHLSNTIDDFRNFFKPDHGKEPTTLDAIVTKTLEIVEVGLQCKGIEIEYKNCSQSRLVTYRNELQQVVLNLIKNAEDALLRREGAKKIYIACYEDDHSVTLQISDNGGGIMPEVMDKIFDPYFSTKGKNGTGLGLYMSKVIVQEHCRGKIEATNTQEGACFTIVLPKSIEE